MATDITDIARLTKRIEELEKIVVPTIDTIMDTINVKHEEDVRRFEELESFVNFIVNKLPVISNSRVTEEAYEKSVELHKQTVSEREEGTNRIFRV